MKINILGYEYEQQIDALDEAWGEVEHCAQTITTAHDMSEAMRFQTLWHESLHAVDFWLGLGLTEQQVEGVATGIAFILRHNQHMRSHE